MLLVLERKKINYKWSLSFLLQPHAYHFRTWKDSKLNRPNVPGYICYAVIGQKLLKAEVYRAVNEMTGSETDTKTHFAFLDSE